MVKAAMRRKRLETAAADNGKRIDRISSLPDHIIHHVMSFLPIEDNARSSALSKWFRWTWTTFPIIDFNKTCASSFLRNGDGDGQERLLNFVGDFLRSRAPDIALQKFSFDGFVVNTESDNRIDNAIIYALENKVKELDLDIQVCNINSVFAYNFPLILFPAKSVTLLKLQGFNLENLDLTKFPSVEECRLKDCNGLRILKVSIPKLEALEIRNCAILEKIEILAPKLESFVYEGGFGQAKSLISTCKFLKKLELHYVDVTDQWGGENVPELPFLENLILSRCCLSKRIKISYEKLKSFQLLRCLGLEEAEILGRNLVLFRYEGGVLRSPLLTESTRLEGELLLEIDSQTPTNAEWYKGLRDFLLNFGHWKLLMIECTPLQCFIFPEDVRENLLPPLFDIKHLKVKMDSLPQDVVTLVESLLWLSPLVETVSIVSRFGENTIKLQHAKAEIREAMEDMDMNLTCCGTRIIKCWRHYLSEVLMVNFNNSDNQRLMEFFKSETVRLKTIVTTQTTSEASKLKLNEEENEEDFEYE